MPAYVKLHCHDFFKRCGLASKPPFCRLRQPEKKLPLVKSYTKRAKRRITHQAAASAWACGVPWSEALCIVKKALAKADGTQKPMRFWGKAKVRGKGKGKGWARHLFYWPFFTAGGASLKFNDALPAAKIRANEALQDLTSLSLVLVIMCACVPHPSVQDYLAMWNQHGGCVE